MEQLELEIKKLCTMLGELLTSYRFDEAYAVAGKLSSLLRDDNSKKLPAHLIMDAMDKVKTFFYANEEVNRQHKRMIAVGHQLLDIAGR